MAMIRNLHKNPAILEEKLTLKSDNSNDNINYYVGTQSWTYAQYIRVYQYFYGTCTTAVVLFASHAKDRSSNFDGNT